jgi:hypothetical protein
MSDVEIDPSRVIGRLGNRIAELEVTVAQQDALIHQLLAERTNGDGSATAPVAGTSS